MNPFPTDRIINGSLCYLIQDNQVLMLRRKRPPHIDKWTAPGGKMELGESPQECVKREMQEETGLTVINPVLRGIVTVYDRAFPIHWLLFIFRADKVKGASKIGDTAEGELRWLPLDGLETFPMPAADQLYLPRLLTNDPLFQLKVVYDTPDKLISTSEVSMTDEQGATRDVSACEKIILLINHLQFQYDEQGHMDDNFSQVSWRDIDKFLPMCGVLPQEYQEQLEALRKLRKPEPK